MQSWTHEAPDTTMGQRPVSRRIQYHLNLIDYALGGLARRRWRNCGLLLVFTAVIFLFGSLQLLTRGLTEMSATLLAAAPDITVQQMLGGRQATLPVTSAAEVDKILGVRQVKTRIWGYHFDEANGANYTVIGMQPQQPPPLLARGRYPEAAGEVVISHQVRQSLQLGQRQSFSLFRPDLTQASFTVVGEFAPETDPVLADAILMSLADGRDLFMMAEDRVTDLLVAVANPREIDTIAAKIAERVPGSRVITRKQILKTYTVVFSWRSGFGSVCLLAALAAFVILAYDRATGLARDDIQEMAILKVLGWQAGEVMAIRFWEAVIVSCTAYVLGYMLAWFHIVWGGGVLFRPLLLGWSVLRPELALVPPFVLGDGLQLFALSVLPYLAATVVPAWKSGMVRPDTVI